VGGLRAHNYWDNDTEFIEPLAGLLRHLVEDRLRRHAPAQQPPASAPPAPSSPPPMAPTGPGDQRV
jgi:hypothetical protein